MSGKYSSGFVSIIGRTNVGKSTLLNRLVGQKVAIMSDKPQTTRNKILGIVTNAEGQVIFMDTPGIHKPQHRLGEYMVTVARQAFKEVDLILYVVEAQATIGAGEEFILNQLKDIKTPVILVVNKVDLVKKEDLLLTITQYSSRYPFAEVVPLSALEGDNVERLMPLILGYMPEGPQYYPEDMVTDQPERTVAAEIIREKILHLTREEIPHSVAVIIEEMKARDDEKVYIHGIIYVERDSQKGIIIGKQGQMLKEIGRQARVELENLLGNPIFLELWVKVKKDWRDREDLLRSFGYDRRNTD